MNKITGKIIDKLTNMPIAEAVVMLNNITGSSVDIAQLSNEKGAFKWLELESGRYALQVVADRYKSQIIHFKCDIDSEIDLVISLLK